MKLCENEWIEWCFFHDGMAMLIASKKNRGFSPLVGGQRCTAIVFVTLGAKNEGATKERGR